MIVAVTVRSSSGIAAPNPAPLASPAERLVTFTSTVLLSGMSSTACVIRFASSSGSPVSATPTSTIVLFSETSVSCTSSRSALSGNATVTVPSAPSEISPYRSRMSFRIGSAFAASAMISVATSAGICPRLAAYAVE